MLHKQFEDGIRTEVQTLQKKETKHITHTHVYTNAKSIGQIMCSLNEF